MTSSSFFSGLRDSSERVAFLSQEKKLALISSNLCKLAEMITSSSHHRNTTGKRGGFLRDLHMLNKLKQRKGVVSDSVYRRVKVFLRIIKEEKRALRISTESASHSAKLSAATN